MKMSFGNSIGFVEKTDAVKYDGPFYGSIIAELTEDCDFGEKIGQTTLEPVIHYGHDSASVEELYALNTAVLEKVYPTKTEETKAPIPAFDYKASAYPTPAVKTARPKVLIPVFPGTNCEYDSAAAFRRAGADPKVLIVKNLTPADVAESCEALVKGIQESQIIMIPGGFSGGDEPDGSAKFITAFFRAPAVTEAVRELLQKRDGLMLGICNGFQALVKLGLVPYGDIRPMDAECPTLTFNTIGRHQSKLVRTRVASNLSPWLSKCNPGDEHMVAISHGEGRFVAPQNVLDSMIAAGQVATQYVNQNSQATMDLTYNPNGSVLAIEGITSPDGRILGKMGHSERTGRDVYKNVPGDKYQPLFEGGVDYFRL